MWTVIKEILQSPVGSFSFVFALISGVMYLIHYATREITKYNCKIDNSTGKVSKLEDNIDSMKIDMGIIKGEIGGIKSEIGGIKSEIGGIKSEIVSINNEISYIKGEINVMKPYIKINSMAQSQSPLSLTKLGIDTAKEMGIEAMILRNSEKVLSFLDESIQSKNAYDIQQFCIESASIFLDKLFSDKDVDFIKLFAYNKGTVTAYYSTMIGIFLRDYYFEKRGIEVKEVDTHDPNKIVSLSK